MPGHASIILTASTYTSVLPGLARATAEAVAAQILTAARTPRPHRGPTLASRPGDMITAGARNRRPGPVGRQGVEP